MATFFTASGQTFTLGSSISSTQTTILLSSFRLPVTGTDITMASMNTSIAYGTLAPGTSSAELISFTGITQNADGTALLTGVTRGLNKEYPYTEDTDFKQPHAGQTIFILSNAPQVFNSYPAKVNAETISGLWTYSTLPETSAGNATTDNQFVRYAQAVALATGTASINRIVVTGTAGETIAVDQLIYLKVLDGRWWLADADAAASSENVVLGIAQGSGTAGNLITNGVLTQGLNTFSALTLTANTQYFASNTAGGFSSTPGTKEVSLGESQTTTTFLFYPRFDQQITEDQQDALAGTSGNPSSSNKYVTADDVSDAAVSGKIVRATGTALPALDGSNLLNVSLIGTFVADGPITTGQSTVISSGGNTNVYAPQAQDVSSTGTTSVTNANKTTWVGQSFTVPSETNLYMYTAILKMSQAQGAGSTSYSITVSIRATSAGLPTGADLATATAVTGSGTAGPTITFTFPTPVLLTTGTTYAFIVRDTGAGTDVNWAFYGNTVSTNSGSTWAADSPLDQVQATTITYGKTTTAGRVLRSNATANDVAANGFLGFATTTSAEGASVSVKLEGIVTGLSGITAGTTYYLSNTGGAIASSAGSQSRKVGLGLSTTTLLIKQDNV